MKKWTLMAGLAGLTLAALTAAAAPWGKGQGFGPCATAALGLTEEQQKRIDGIREDCAKELSPLQSQLFAKKQELRALWAEPSPDAQKIRAVQKEVSGLRDRMQDRSVQCKIDQRAVLTPEQQQQFAGLEKGCGMGCSRGGCGGGGCAGAGGDCQGGGKGRGYRGGCR